jgi:hypothetical protein
MNEVRETEKGILDAVSPTEIYDAINTQFIDHNFDGKGNCLIGAMHGNRLTDVEEFLGRVEKTEDLAFAKDGKVFKELALAGYFQEMPSLRAQEQWGWEYSPKVKLFFEEAKSLGNMFFKVPHLPAWHSTEGEIFNHWIQRLRQRLRSKEFKAQLHQQGFRTARRFRRLRKNVEKLFALYSRVLVVRLDLLFHGREVGLDEAQQFYAKFVNNQRHNKLFRDLLWSVRRLDFGVIREHHHFHVVLFFDGSKVWKDAYLGEQLGEYWKKVTNGLGHYHNCNRDKSRYKRLGIGMISHDDVERRDNLLLALAYLTKKDQLLWVPTGQKVRAIESGRLRDRKHSGKGRPRRSTADADESGET